jgi:dolichol-phosphate mannosyltransferase
VISSPAIESPRPQPKVAVVVPCFRVREKIVGVVESLIGRVDYIFAVDDKCPEKSGEWLRENCRHPSVKVVFHDSNQGVGGPWRRMRRWW